MNVPPRLREVAGPVLAAVAVVFLVDLLLTPPRGVLGIVARAVSFASGAAFAFAVGWWLGTRAWPRRGRRLARRVLERMLRAKHQPFLVLTDRPDRTPSRWRRLLEVVAFAAGVSIILTAALATLGAPPAMVRALGGAIVLAALWGAFTLVPYWTFVRMGLRVVDPVLWTVTPVSRKYADRLRLSNGALLLLALGVVVNLAVRAGLSQDEALVQGIGTVVTIAVSTLVIAATGVAYFAVEEPGLVKEMEKEALALGVRDARGRSDGDLLPGLR